MRIVRTTRSRRLQASPRNMRPRPISAVSRPYIHLPTFSYCLRSHGLLRRRFDIWISFTFDTLPHSAQPTVLFILGRQSLELARIKPDAVALVAAIDLDAFVNDLNKRALTLRTMNRRSLCLFLPTENERRGPRFPPPRPLPLFFSLFPFFLRLFFFSLFFFPVSYQSPTK